MFFTLKNVKPTEEEYFNFNQNKDAQKKHEEFWTDLIFHLQGYFEKELNFVSFAY